MSYRAYIEDIVSSLRNSADLEQCVYKTTLAHYGGRLIDCGNDLDRLYAENERLRTIVDLIELKNERDALSARVRELEDEKASILGYPRKDRR